MKHFLILLILLIYVNPVHAQQRDYYNGARECIMRVRPQDMVPSFLPNNLMNPFSRGFSPTAVRNYIQTMRNSNQNYNPGRYQGLTRMYTECYY